MILAICVDDPKQLEELSEYINEISDMKQVHFSSGKALLKAIRKGQRFDITLIDMELSDRSGIEIARILHACQPQMDIVFLSSCPRYVTQAFSLQAAQFFLKPVPEKMFLKEMERIIKHQKIEKKSWCIQTKRAIYRLSPTDIIYIKIYGRHLMIQTTRQEIEIPGRLAAAERELKDYDFVRCHQGFLVNLRHVQAMEDHQIRCSFGKYVPVSNRMRQPFLDALEQYRA